MTPRFTIRPTTSRMRVEWPWAIYDSKHKKEVGHCSNKETAESTARGLNENIRKVGE